MILLMLGVYVEIVLKRLADNSGLLDALRRAFGG